MIKHPGFSQVFSKISGIPDYYYINDIAIVELEQPFEFGETTNILPACLLDKKDLQTFEGHLYAAGYGVREAMQRVNNPRAEKDVAGSASAGDWLLNRDFVEASLSAAPKTSLMMTNLDQYRGVKCKHNMICARHDQHSACFG